jgi:hypothetical protein
MFSLWNRSMIYTKIYTVLVHVLRWNPSELPRTISSISSVPIYTVTSSFVGALITVVCGPTWTNQWKVCCCSHVMQVWTIKYASINTTRNQLPDQQTRRRPTFIHPKVDSTTCAPSVYVKYNTCLRMHKRAPQSRGRTPHWPDLTTRVTTTLAGASHVYRKPRAYIYVYKDF